MSRGSKAALDASAAHSRWLGCGSALGAGLAVLGMLAGAAGAAEYDENPDAGDIPSTAQSTAGPASTALDAINGDILDEFDQDMFKIFIDDPVAFSASTNNPETSLPPTDDTMLYLFDENGLAVLASDDIDGLNFKTTLSAGSLDDAGGGAGIYYVAISKAYNYPSSNAGDIVAGEIWNPDRLSEETSTLDMGLVPNRGSGWDVAVAAWGNQPFNAGAGPYRIELTGASFAEESALVPVMGPAASVGLSLLLGACGIGALRIRSSRKELDT
jgi:hypothetical protein